MGGIWYTVLLQFQLRGEGNMPGTATILRNSHACTCLYEGSVLGKMG